MTRLPPLLRRRGEEAADETRWASHRAAAFAIRCAVRLVPVLVAIGVSVLALHLLPESFTGTIWPGRVLLVGLAVVASLLTERLARKALPLAVLLQLTLLFPDKAPSRLKVARRGSKEAQDRAEEDDGNVAAERVLSLLAALTGHDRRTRGHCERVRVYADMLGAELNLARADQDRLRWAALLHDIGKLEVDPEILNKPAKPSEREWLILRAHPEQGARLAAPLLGWLGEWGFAIEHHHERYDGTGYPQGLVGDDISRAGRLLSIVDAYEVMTAARPYKRAMNPRAAREELARCAGTHFDPALVRAFLEISLPRLLWTTGPLSLIGQLPFLGRLSQLATTVPSGAAAAGPVTVLAASVVVTSAALTPLNVTPSTPQIQSAANPVPAPTIQSTPAPPDETPGSPSVDVVPTTTPATSGAPTSSAEPETPTPPVDPEPAPDPTPDPAPPVTPPVVPPPVVPPPVVPPPAPPTPAPAVAITSAPAATVNQATAHFVFDAPGADSLEYALDAGAWTATTSTLDLTGVTDGGHTLQVRALLGTEVGAPTSASWIVDTTAPVLTFTAQPSTQTNQTTAHVAWTLDDPAATTTCQLDVTAASPCSLTFDASGVANGTHTVTIAAVDQAGNPSTWSVTWTVNNNAPVVTITQSPTGTTRQTSANVVWTVSDPSATVTCQLDGGTPFSCSGNQSFSNLVDGPHTVVVTATDNLGNAGSDSRTWTVDRTDPVITITSQPSLTLIGPATMTWTVDDPTATVTCSLDGGPPVACNGTFTVSGAALSNHTVVIEATDAAGNNSSRSISWTQLF